MTGHGGDRIGPVQAAWLIARLTVMAEPKRRALIEACAAKCPPDKNKQQTHQPNTVDKLAA